MKHGIRPRRLISETIHVGSRTATDARSRLDEHKRGPRMRRIAKPFWPEKAVAAIVERLKRHGRPWRVLRAPHGHPGICLQERDDSPPSRTLASTQNATSGKAVLGASRLWSWLSLDSIRSRSAA